MTTPFERTRALVQAGDLLEELRKMPEGTIPESLRQYADGVLRHYPSSMEIRDMSRQSMNPSPFDAAMLDPEGVPEDAPNGYRR